jgi:pimeloyl-ACP methyl ester carboxylesterase
MPNSLLPPDSQKLTESTSLTLADQIQQQSVQTPLSEHPIPTTFVKAGQGQPVLLIHGFDSSLLEFRRLIPYLEAQAETLALDLLGFGFTDRTVCPNHSPGSIKLHLHSFWQQCIGQPVVLIGASMGGAAAIDFALTYPEAVAGLVLLDSAGFAAGPALDKVMFPPLDSWATGFLANTWVRRQISRQAYCDKSFVTADAERCAALHLQCPGWKEALIAFTKSGGYNFLSEKIAQISCPTLVVWGEQDTILGTADATKFRDTLPNCQLVWIPQCGHVPHLEKPQQTAAAIVEFLPQCQPWQG